MSDWQAYNYLGYLSHLKKNVSMTFTPTSFWNIPSAPSYNENLYEKSKELFCQSFENI